MRASSLRLRLILGGALAIVAALAIAGTALTLVFERHVARTIADDLDIYLDQLVGGIDSGPAGELLVTRPPADPRFAEPLSGLYWQVASDDGRMVRSRSLWDTALSVPADEPAPGEIHHHAATGPNGARMLVSERRLALTLGERPVPVRAVVATDLARVSAASSAFARDLAVALAILAVVLSAATSLQVMLGLSPLAALRRGVADVRSGRRRRLPETVPREVTPLVEEVNGLLEAQEREIERSRGRAADLAHGLKTPLAALAADARRLRGRGEPSIARDIEAVADAMSRQIDRELARARVRAGVRAAAVSTELAPLARAVIATLVRTPAGGRVLFEQCVPDGLHVPIDRTDLVEVLGNLMDNAAQHAATRVRIAAQAGATGVAITIEDDGPGIAPAARSQALRRGVRLDERGTGAGLGLAIVQDILDAYGWPLDLSTSELGGLKATVAPAQRDRAPAERACIPRSTDAPAQEADRLLTAAVSGATSALSYSCARRHQPPNMEDAMRKLTLATLLFFAASTAPALTDDQANGRTDPAGNPVTMDVMRQKIVALGYDVHRLRADDGRFEAIIIDRQSGGTVKAVFSKATGDLIIAKPGI